METWQALVGGSSFVIAAIILRYCGQTRKKTGPLYSQAYLALSDEEKKYFDKDAEYERITIVYGLIGVFFVLIGITAFSVNKVFAILAFVVLAADLIYCLVKLIQARSKM